MSPVEIGDLHKPTWRLNHIRKTNSTPHDGRPPLLTIRTVLVFLASASCISLAQVSLFPRIRSAEGFPGGILGIDEGD